MRISIGRPERHLRVCWNIRLEEFSIRKLSRISSTLLGGSWRSLKYTGLISCRWYAWGDLDGKGEPVQNRSHHVPHGQAELVPDPIGHQSSSRQPKSPLVPTPRARTTQRVLHRVQCHFTGGQCFFSTSNPCTPR